jgi:hypothetical protein
LKDPAGHAAADCPGTLKKPGEATQSTSSSRSLASLPGAALSAGHFVHTLLLMAADIVP